MASNPKHEGVPLSGVRLEVTNYASYEPVRTGIAVVRAAYWATPAEARADFFNERWFDLLAGSSSIRESLVATQ